MKRSAIALAACGLIFSSGQALAADALTVADVLKDVQINGALSAGYNYNFNEPHTRAINLRPFNDAHNSFALELAQLAFHKDAANAGEAGFRLDLNFGYTVPKAIHSTGAASSDDFDVRQAYISYVAPVGSGLKLDFGKFVTDHGLEVIEGYEDWNLNYSRSFLFYYSIPFTHTGLRATYKVGDMFTLSGAVVNGWDNVKDNNNSKSFHAHAIITPLPDMTVNLKYMAGTEANDTRHLFNVNLSKSFGALTLKADYVYGSEDNVPSIGDSTWTGVAGYARYAVSEKFAMNLRAEVFSDNEGARTGTAQDLWEVTLTPEYTINDNLVVRAEYRHDESNKDSFDKGASVSDTQDTLGVNAVYHF
ncbi:MAG: porin [Deltaproteobacteria bacterium]|nr:porin [Deltaproteobacteria bacterium]